MLLQVYINKQDSEQINKYTWNDRASTNTALEDIKERHVCIIAKTALKASSGLCIHWAYLMKSSCIWVPSRGTDAGCWRLLSTIHATCVHELWELYVAVWFPDQATVVSRYLKKPSGKAGFNCPLWKKFSLMPSPSSAAFNCRRLLWYLQPWLLIIFLLCTFKGYVCGLSATSPNWCGKIRIEVSDALHSTCIYSYCLF